jgi:phenylacetate-CoA ligase
MKNDLLLFFPVLRDWLWIERAQWWSREKLIDVQNKKLHALVNYAFHNVPFYHKLYTSAGVDPGSVVDVESLRRLPIITKDDLRRVPLEERTARGVDVKKCEVRQTSGSTGVPLVILNDRRTAAFFDAYQSKILWDYGVRLLDKVCRVIPTALGREVSAGRLADMAGLWGFIRRRKARPLSLATDINSHLDFFLSWKPDVIIANPSYLRALLMVCEERDKYPRFRVVVTRGELLDLWTRKLIMNSLGAEVFDIYGSAEVGAIAFECPTHTAYHVCIDATVVEFLRGNEPVSSGEAGELCVTGLHKWATPVIRYRIGDVAVPIDDECLCGRGLPLMRDIQGRIVDFVVRLDGRYVSPQLVMYTLQDVDGVDQYRVVQRKDYLIEVFIRVSKDDDDVVLHEVKRRCRLLFGDTPTEVRLVDRIFDPSKPKFKIVESHVVKNRF